MKSGSVVESVFAVLFDKKWHCRSHDYVHIPSSQIAGSGGIQGLKRGTQSRSGLKIESCTKYCGKCHKKTRWDRWTGKFQTATTHITISDKVKQQILTYYNYKDVVEQRIRAPHELVIDHRFPMLRWGGIEEKLPKELTSEVIEGKFQLLKCNDGNQNLLKSRACETCFKTGKRGTPFGIRHFYQGNENWPDNTPKMGKKAENGCVGCGWYDFEKWRNSLNTKNVSEKMLTNSEIPSIVKKVKGTSVSDASQKENAES